VKNIELSRISEVAQYIKDQMEYFMNFEFEEELNEIIEICKIRQEIRGGD